MPCLHAFLFLYWSWKAWQEMDPGVETADGENVLEEGISAPTPPTVLPEQEAHFLPMQLCSNSFAVLWQGQPQSSSSWVVSGNCGDGSVWTPCHHWQAVHRS